MTIEVFLFPPLIGGSYDGPKRTLPMMTITVGFSEESSAEDRTNLKYNATIAYTEKAIRRFLLSDEYQQGKIKAALSRGTEGTNVAIGDPPSWVLVEKSNARLCFGRIRPERGLVSPKTYDGLRDLGSPGYRTNPLRICGATIVMDDDVPDGFIRWFYGRV
jgi:hypothetical protein